MVAIHFTQAVSKDKRKFGPVVSLGWLADYLYMRAHTHAHLRPVEAAYCTNGEPSLAQDLPPGVYGVSNQRLDSPWKKVTRGKERFAEVVSGLQCGSLGQSECERQLLDLLCDDTWLVYNCTVYNITR